MAVQTKSEARDVAGRDHAAARARNRTAHQLRLGRKNTDPIGEHPVVDRVAASPVPQQRADAGAGAPVSSGRSARATIYVDVLETRPGRLWVAVHFGSRGFGYKTAERLHEHRQRTRVRRWTRRKSEMKAPPLLLPLDAPRGQDYLEAMAIAGEYAYAGREVRRDRVLELKWAPTRSMPCTTTTTLRGAERHHGDDFVVIRKGATPAFPPARVSLASMGDISVIVAWPSTPPPPEVASSQPSTGRAG